MTAEDDPLVTGPFTGEQVASMSAYQDSGLPRPLFCQDPLCRGFGWSGLPLRADQGGLFCMSCGGQREGVPVFITNWDWRKRRARRKRAVRRKPLNRDGQGGC